MEVNSKVRTEILQRDNYTCQRCTTQNKTLTCQTTIYYPRFASKDTNGAFLFFKPFIVKKKKFLAATKDNIIDVDYKRRVGNELEVIKHAYHYKKLSEDHKTDGYELCKKLSLYREKNPFKMREKIKSMNVRAILHVHHKDKDKSNNDTDNLITLCYFCHQDVHKRYF